MSLPSSRWRVERPTEEGDFTLSFQVGHVGKPVTLTLTITETEQLHAALCYALAGQRPPDEGDVPECRLEYRRGGPVVRWP
ncbi:hypothetical protein LRS74_20270 [Streptomyces sp. LX-29]|uniref:hypothetical protein n=1 Tax=Streptomyces sp. LX-29 TaxID=2900152 RepID=UPI00240D8362|nr:hypothetical protein [Streptomyces sp. LX-29]WFB09109.1 hypothetical protein LRS74_20270 [Streptomyces sp. LX-29]